MTAFINQGKGIWGTCHGSSAVLIETTLEKMVERVDLTLLNRLLRLAIDVNISDYLTSRNNVNVAYKDMLHCNSYGLVRGLQFSAFLVQYYSIVFDLSLVGISRSNSLYVSANSKGGNKVVQDEREHPIHLYQRYINRIYIVAKFTGKEAVDLFTRHNSTDVSEFEDFSTGYNNKGCWNRDGKMRMRKRDVNLGKCVFFRIQNENSR